MEVQDSEIFYTSENQIENNETIKEKIKEIFEKISFSVNILCTEMLDSIKYVKQSPKTIFENHTQKEISLEKIKSFVNELEKITFGENSIEWLSNEIFNKELENWKRLQKFEKKSNFDKLKVIKLWINKFINILMELDQLVIEFISLMETIMEIYSQNMQNVNVNLDIIIFPIQIIVNSLKTSQNILHKIQKTIKFAINSSFIVSKQPDQVIKRGNQLKMDILGLIDKSKNLLSDIIVRIVIVNENQATEIEKDGNKADKLKYLNSGEIENNLKPMVFDEKTGYFVTNFEKYKTKLVKVFRNKKNKKVVTDELFCFYFEINFKVRKISRTICIPTIPFVVILAVNQAANAWGTISVYNFFAQISTQNPNDFIKTIPDKILWSDMCQILDLQFKKLGHGLTKENLDYLGHLIGVRVLNEESYIELSMLNKGKGFGNGSFWEWYLSIVKMVQDDLLSKWKAGYIFGFVSKERANEILSSPGILVGTFLLRFSEKNLGNLTIFYLNEYCQVDSAIFEDDVSISKQISLFLKNPCNKLKFVYSPSKKLVPISEAFHSQEDNIKKSQDSNYEYPKVIKFILTLVNKGKNK